MRDYCRSLKQLTYIWMATDNNFCMYIAHYTSFIVFLSCNTIRLRSQAKLEKKEGWHPISVIPYEVR